jgi:hypothetical protein
MSGITETGAVVSHFGNSWKLPSHLANHSNFLSFPSNSVVGLEKHSWEFSNSRHPQFCLDQRIFLLLKSHDPEKELLLTKIRIYSSCHIADDPLASTAPSEGVSHVPLHPWSRSGYHR